MKTKIPEDRKLNIFSSINITQTLLVVLFFICLDTNAQVRKAIFMNRTGTITAAMGSDIVTGAGTSFLTELTPGNSIYKNAVGANGGVPSLGEVLSIQSNTQLTLKANSPVNANGDIYCSSEFTSTDFENLACAIKAYLDAHHYDYVMKHISPCPGNPDCGNGVVKEQIHQDVNFLPWHRHFINEMEEHFMLTPGGGLKKFVPMPYWNPATPIPDAFFNGPCAKAEVMGTDFGFLPNIIKQDINNVPQFNGAAKTFWADAWSGSSTCNFMSRQDLAHAMGPLSGPHGAVHIAIQPPNGVDVHHAPGYTWFYIWHSFVDDVWRKWECTCSNSPGQQISGVDLFMMDRNSDEGLPMMESLDLGYQPFVTTKELYTSKDIWVRNQQDGFTTDVHENPEYRINTPVYVYVRVRNRSCTDYAGGGTLDLHWAKAATALSWPKPWDGSEQCNGGPVMGGLIPSSHMQTIPPIVKGGHAIMEFEWFLPDPSAYNNCNTQPWHFCLLARIVDPNDPMVPETQSLGDNIVNNNNIVWKNLSIVDMIPGNFRNEDCSNEMLTGGVIAVGSPSDLPDTYDINFKLPDDIGSKTPIIDAAEVKAVLDEATWNKWQAGGSLGQNVIVKNAACHIIKITGNPASIKNLFYSTNERSTMYVTFNVLTDHLTTEQEFDYEVTQTRTNDGAEIGGELYHIIKHDGLLFTADAGPDQSIERNATATLEAKDIGEPANYNWYVGGNLIASGRVIQVAPLVNTQYELEVISLTSGFKCYDEVNVNIKPFAITSLNPNPATDQLTVNYYAEQALSAEIIIMQPYSYQNVYPINPQSTSNSINIDVSGYTPGLYFVVLLCNGNPADMKTVVIE